MAQTYTFVAIFMNHGKIHWSVCTTICLFTGPIDYYVLVCWYLYHTILHMIYPTQYVQVCKSAHVLYRGQYYWNNCLYLKLFWYRLIRSASGFELSLVRSSETSKNDSQTSGIPAGLVRRTTAYFWFSYQLHWLYIFQTSEWCIRESDFTIHLPDGQVHSIWNFKAWVFMKQALEPFIELVLHLKKNLMDSFSYIQASLQAYKHDIHHVP